MYKLSGKRIDLTETFDDEKVFSENDIFQLTTNWLPIMEGDNEGGDQTSTLSNPHLLKLSKSEAESYSHSPDSQHLGSLGSSGSDYLDSDLVNAAIERLNLDENSVSLFIFLIAIKIFISKYTELSSMNTQVYKYLFAVGISINVFAFIIFLS